MKIEKIKNYNQKLLAIIGTLVAIFILIGLVSLIVISINEYRMYNSYDNKDNGILSEEKIEKLQKENKREQVISYNNPKLIDSLNSIYIIPVSHRTLNKPEDLGLLNMSKDYEEKEIDKRYSRAYYGDFNNILIYDQKTEINTKFFNQRVNFDEIKTEYFKDDILLLIEISEKDTYKDGVINLKDLKTLYIYSFKNKKIKKVENKGTDVYSYSFLNNTKDLIIRFGIDKNKNGKFESHNEPTVIKKYNFLTEKLTDVVDKKIDVELQKMLEGS